MESGGIDRVHICIFRLLGLYTANTEQKTQSRHLRGYAVEGR